MQPPELLLPAGSWEQFQAGLLYGGDAFYLTVGNLSLRATTKGFSWDNLAAALKLAQNHQKRIYFCLNLFAYEKHLPAICDTLEKLNDYPIHALIIADPGIIQLAQKYLPQVSIHLSTQANTSNSQAISFWQQQGIERVNLARELNYKEIHAIRAHCPKMELEMFVHGSMCMAISGRCLLSAYLNNRSANLGQCTQPCRFKYHPTALLLEEEFRNNQPIWELTEDYNYSHILAADDLCLVKYMRWFIHAGINAIKIEGRTKSGVYIARVADVYKTALLDTAQNKSQLKTYLNELAQIGSRRLTTGLFLPKRKTVLENYAPNQPIIAQLQEQLADDKWLVQIKSTWHANTSIHLMLPGLQRPSITANEYYIEDTKGNKLTTANPGIQAQLRLNHPDLKPGVYLTS